MTREEAIIELRAIFTEAVESENSVCYVTEEDREPLKMAIQALEQEPCEDTISKQAVLSYIYNDLGLGDEENGADIERQVELQSFYDYVKSYPPVTSQSKIGRWIIKDGKEQGYDIAGIKTWYVQIMCNQCGFIKTAIEGHTGQHKYCPQCGAKMYIQS